MKNFLTKSSAQTKKLGQLLAEELRGGEIICLMGDLGAGKTTFTQGLLRGLGVRGTITSPTFNIIKIYNLKAKSYELKAIYHIDAYRINSKDLSDLGWKDFAGKSGNIVIIEWAEKIKKIIPASAAWMKFEWINDKERKITIL